MAKFVDTVGSLSMSVCSTFTDSTDHGSKMVEKRIPKRKTTYIAFTLYLQVFKQHLQCIRDDK